ncbi:MAG: TAXI family TRAP transporter solute-binding subunit [Butyricicoccus sp.]|nr:TAXI family TRAP transporter solute-binding subunit [Butyricicoccus sp.]
MKKKSLALIALVLVMGLLLCACGDSSAPADNAAPSDNATAVTPANSDLDSPAPADNSTPAPAPSASSMVMGTGGTTGTYYAFGNVLSGYMTDASGVAINVVSTDGSAADIYGVDDGMYQLATVQSDVMAYAWEGSKTFADDGEIKSFLVIGGLYEEAVQIVTMDPSIKTVADLAGKNVSIGAPGSGVYFNAIDVLEAYGLSEDSIKPQYLSFGESTDAMKDGKIDAAFIVAGPPTPAITELCTTNGAYLVNIEDSVADELLKTCPYYNKHVIPAGTYAGIDEDTYTVSVKATMIVSADADENDVYNLTAGIFNNIDAITGAHAKGAELSLENATSGMAVPFHPGAAKYYADNGISVDNVG